MQMARAGATLLGVLLFALLAGFAAGEEDCYHDIIRCCNETIKKEGPYISPSQVCRREVRKADMPCVCHILTAYDERTVSPEKLVRCAHDSGVDLPVGSICGSKQTRSSNWRHLPPPPHYHHPPTSWNSQSFRHPPPPPPHHHPPTSWNSQSFRHPPPPPPHHHPPTSWNSQSFRHPPPPPPPHHHPPTSWNNQSFRHPPPPPPHHHPPTTWNGHSFRHPPPPPPHHQPPRPLCSSIGRSPEPPYSKPHT
ncbi:uncharacterized protein [Aegilops tauschii subsp. strangulata]|uniref:uncharacterized protein n=1 Tax=Aegilops tauschii subsp. strangulata TaxID=200361 RepID=UPI00098B3748